MLERLVDYNVDKYPDIYMYIYIYSEQLRKTANKSDICKFSSDSNEKSQKMEFL